MRKLFLLLPLVLLTACGVDTVSTGHRGIKTRYGKVVGEPLAEGLYFYNPITSTIRSIDVRTQTYAEKTEVYTKDVQKSEFAFNLNYNPDKDKVGSLYQNVGMDYDDKLIPQVVQASIKNVVGQWDAVDLISHRAEAGKAIEDAITATLEQNFIHVSRFEITNIDYTPEFEKSVEAKVIAKQDAEKAQNQTVQITEQAKQKVIAAKAEAESMQIRSAALSQNQNLVAYEAVQKWDGKLPTYMMGNSVPFVSVPSGK